MTSDVLPDETALGPLARYRQRVAAGGLKADPCQELAAEKLESLAHALADYKPAEGAGGWRERLGLARRPDPAPQGLYIFGAVGRGKSMLMDLFFAAAPVARKRRVHFHAFMLEVHQRLHELRQGEENGKAGDPIPPLALQIAADATLLCFDEFQVTNIADAMILGRLFTALFERGVVVVATSNTAPDDLYANGLQRDRFLPAIETLKQHLDVLELDGDVDYRRTRIKGMKVYYTPLGAAATQALEQAFARLTEGAAPEPATLRVQGRTLTLPRTARGVAMTSFAELCEKPLWSADYLGIATHYHTLVLDGVPIMQAEQRNEARRFITLIDALYEHRVKLVCAAAAIPEKLYATGEHAGEFERTASRLFEMQSEEYLASPHLT